MTPPTFEAAVRSVGLRQASTRSKFAHLSSVKTVVSPWTVEEYGVMSRMIGTDIDAEPAPVVSKEGNIKKALFKFAPDALRTGPRCPLSGVKRTQLGHRARSAKCHNRTLVAQQTGLLGRSGLSSTRTHGPRRAPPVFFRINGQDFNLIIQLF